MFLLRFVCLLTTASCTGKSGHPVICTSLQQDITRLYNWSLTWQMVFNTKKCHILSISRKRDRPTITYTLGTERLSVLESYPYLGVPVSSDLRWHHHINTISNKATRTLNFICRNTYGCSPEAKALAYSSLIRPHLEYASAVWDPYTARDSNKLDKVQRWAARFVRRDYRRTTLASQLISELGWQSLAERRKTSRLTLLCKAINQWLGGLPYGRTWTHIKMYSALWTVRTYYPTVSCWCL